MKYILLSLCFLAQSHFLFSKESAKKNFISMIKQGVDQANESMKTQYERSGNIKNYDKTKRKSQDLTNQMVKKLSMLSEEDFDQYQNYTTNSLIVSIGSKSKGVKDYIKPENKEIPPANKVKEFTEIDKMTFNLRAQLLPIIEPIKEQKLKLEDKKKVDEEMQLYLDKYIYFVYSKMSQDELKEIVKIHNESPGALRVQKLMTEYSNKMGEILYAAFEENAKIMDTMHAKNPHKNAPSGGKDNPHNKK
ncbi:MAG: hypothetical protein H6622_11650 [Halobacteriovoraceae bacterium]|nr:hypothetical protein [Halobacteriovoraceae bacterium]